MNTSLLSEAHQGLDYFRVKDIVCFKKSIGFLEIFPWLLIESECYVMDESVNNWNNFGAQL